MKKGLMFLAILSIFSFSGWAQSAVLEVTQSTHNFGNVQQGIPVKHKFTIKNTGSQPLVIDKVNTTCGCTATQWPKEPIMPGESASITAQYNAAKMGYFKKPATIISNASNGQVKLFLEGTVVKKSDLTDAPEDADHPEN